MAGRPKGSHDIAPKIRSAILTAIDKMHERTGKTLSEKLSEYLDSDPISTLNMVSRYMPKEIEVSGKNGGAIEITELSREERINRISAIFDGQTIEGIGQSIDDGDTDMGSDSRASETGDGVRG